MSTETTRGELRLETSLRPPGQAKKAMQAPAGSLLAAGATEWVRCPVFSSQCPVFSAKETSRYAEDFPRFRSNELLGRLRLCAKEVCRNQTDLGHDRFHRKGTRVPPTGVL